MVPTPRAADVPNENWSMSVCSGSVLPDESTPAPPQSVAKAARMAPAEPARLSKTGKFSLTSLICTVVWTLNGVVLESWGSD